MEGCPYAAVGTSPDRRQLPDQSRQVTGERAALGERATGAGEVLARLRQAAINQSVDDMSRLYAVDAVHEFPFTAPGFPSPLFVRVEFRRWIASAGHAGSVAHQ